MCTVHHQLWSLGLATEEEKRHKHKRSSDMLWKEFFRDPSQWWDKRTSKEGPRYPDFKHKVTNECLWTDGWRNPSWVSEELRSRGLVLSSGELCQKNEASAASPLGVQDESVALVASLRACSKNKDLYRGTRLHDDILKRGMLEKCSDALVTMYAKCGELGKAQALLDMHKSRDVITWTALISGYARVGRGQNALDCFERMQCEGIPPNAVTYTCILKACANIGAIDKGKEIHDNIARQGLLDNDVLGTALVDMYAKCGALSKAQDVLENLSSRDVVAWSALISGYAQEGRGEQALNCFDRMQSEGIPPNAATYACILKSCAAIGAVDKGREIHDIIVRQGLLQNNIVLGTALADMYAKCGALSKAQYVLDKLPSRNVVSWSALIAGGYAQEGQGVQALNCFERMQCEGIPPNAVTYACILKACASIGAVEKGKEIHAIITRLGLLQNNIVLGTALVDMYAKCGALSKAQDVLDKLPSRDVISWSALISGYAQECQGEQALNCFERMQREGIPPSAATYICILKACAAIGAIDKGKEIHDNIVRQGLLQTDIALGTALVDMYVKCGANSKAQDVLEKLSSRDVVTWNALISGYAQEGQGEQALNSFERMEREGIPPNAVTFRCVLNVCSHLGLVEEGHAVFVNMSTKYGVNPSLECYTCMVDLFGRAGHLEKAVQLIQEMPSSDYSIIWLALLGACQKWGDVNVGRWAFEQAVHLDKSDGPAYVLMANLYAAAGMQENAKSIETMRIRDKAWKMPGCSSWIDSSKDVHAFSVGDTMHTQSECIYAKLEDIARKMSQQVYSPGLHWVSPKFFDAAKAHLLCGHSEQLALACALINTPQSETICIRKNMRMCGDCHVATSLISKIEMRTIIVTDANFRHCFEDGKCSCNDYL